MTTHRTQLTALLADINRQIAKAEQITVARGDDVTLLTASNILSELREQMRYCEEKLKQQ